MGSTYKQSLFLITYRLTGVCILGNSPKLTIIFGLKGLTIHETVISKR